MECKKHKHSNMRTLKLSLRYRPKLFRMILNMKFRIKRKSRIIMQLKQQMAKKNITPETLYASTQTDNDFGSKEIEKPKKDSFTQASQVKQEHTKNKTGEEEVEKGSLWDLKENGKDKSIADQVKEVAQSALQETGMVYVESAGMYYDYKTGYYYNSELGLYYHTDTGCYYYYSEEKKTFVFHSYPDRSAVNHNTALEAHEKRKAKKHKVHKGEDRMENLTKIFSKEIEDGNEEVNTPKRRKKSKKVKRKTIIKSINKETTSKSSDNELKQDIAIQELKENLNDAKKNEEEINAKETELEDGECSESENEESKSDTESLISTSTATDDDESIAKHHPPCMRVIVRETNLPKLKVGNLFLVTKDGGTLGREGDQHTIIIRDSNISRTHLDIKYDMEKKIYTLTDLGSKNGTILNGLRMSESQEVSEPMEVIHGSTIQLGETKLLCHIHPGNDTCGHCEPGLIMDTQEKKKVAYTRTCSVQKQYQLELARLKNKYAPEPLAIEGGEYHDRAKERRHTVGSSHSSEKTQSTDLETHIMPNNKGFKLLEKMGWSKGEGLGKDSSGNTEPIPLVSNESKAGLGNPSAAAHPSFTPVREPKNLLGPATMRLASRTNMLNPPAKAFQEKDDDDDIE